MKPGAVIGFIILFVTSIVAKDMTALGFDIWYLTHKSYIAKNLCENKDRPQLKCNGKCHLAKKLKQLEEPTPDSGKKSSVPLKIKEFDWTSASASQHNLLSVTTAFSSKANCKGGYYRQSFSAQHLRPVFHPPAFV